MDMNSTSHLWGQKNATLSDKNAEKEYGISRKEIIDAINSGDLQFREGSTHGNPWYRLLRVEVEKYVTEKYGNSYLHERKSKKELTEINKELKLLKSRINELEARKLELAICTGGNHV
jgi:hypothetical protein